MAKEKAGSYASKGVCLRDMWQYRANAACSSQRILQGVQALGIRCGKLALLCEQCHTKVHSETDFLKYVISRLPLDGPNSRDEITGLLVGYLGYFTEEEAKEGRMNRYVLLGIEAKKKGNQDGV